MIIFFFNSLHYELDIRKYLLGSNEKIDGDIITMRTDLLKTDITKAPLVDFFPYYCRSTARSLVLLNNPIPGRDRKSVV